MKKIITTALALALTLGMSVSAFAASSPSTDVTVDSIATLADGTTVTVTSNIIEDGGATTAAAEAQVASLVTSSSKVVSQAFDVEISETVSESKPVTIGFTLGDVTSGTSLKALHYKESTGTWEALDCTWSNGKVYVTFTSLSPVVFVEVIADSTSTDDGYQDGTYDKYLTSSSDDTSDSTTSPKTADAGVFGLAFAAVICGAALVCVNRKKTA